MKPAESETSEALEPQKGYTGWLKDQGVIFADEDAFRTDTTEPSIWYLFANLEAATKFRDEHNIHRPFINRIDPRLSIDAKTVDKLKQKFRDTLPKLSLDAQIAEIDGQLKAIDAALSKEKFDTVSHQIKPQKSRLSYEEKEATVQADSRVDKAAELLSNKSATGWWMHAAAGVVEIMESIYLAKNWDILSDEDRKKLTELQTQLVKTDDQGQFVGGLKADANFVSFIKETLRENKEKRVTMIRQDVGFLLDGGNRVIINHETPASLESLHPQPGQPQFVQPSFFPDKDGKSDTDVCVLQAGGMDLHSSMRILSKEKNDNTPGGYRYYYTKVDAGAGAEDVKAYTAETIYTTEVRPEFETYTLPNGAIAVRYDSLTGNPIRMSPEDFQKLQEDPEKYREAMHVTLFSLLSAEREILTYRAPASSTAINHGESGKGETFEWSFQHNKIKNLSGERDPNRCMRTQFQKTGNCTVYSLVRLIEALLKDSLLGAEIMQNFKGYGKRMEGGKEITVFDDLRTQKAELDLKREQLLKAKQEQAEKAEQEQAAKAKQEQAAKETAEKSLTAAADPSKSKETPTSTLPMPHLVLTEKELKRAREGLNYLKSLAASLDEKLWPNKTKERINKLKRINGMSEPPFAAQISTTPNQVFFSIDALKNEFKKLQDSNPEIHVELPFGRQVHLLPKYFLLHLEDLLERIDGELQKAEGLEAQETRTERKDSRAQPPLPAHPLREDAKPADTKLAELSDLKKRLEEKVTLLERTQSSPEFAGLALSDAEKLSLDQIRANLNSAEERLKVAQEEHNRGVKLFQLTHPVSTGSGTSTASWQFLANLGRDLKKLEAEVQRAEQTLSSSERSAGHSISSGVNVTEIPPPTPVLLPVIPEPPLPVVVPLPAQPPLKKEEEWTESDLALPKPASFKDFTIDFSDRKKPVLAASKKLADYIRGTDTNGALFQSSNEDDGKFILKSTKTGSGELCGYYTNRFNQPSISLLKEVPNASQINDMLEKMLKPCVKGASFSQGIEPAKPNPAYHFSRNIKVFNGFGRSTFRPKIDPALPPHLHPHPPRPRSEGRELGEVAEKAEELTVKVEAALDKAKDSKVIEILQEVLKLLENLKKMIGEMIEKMAKKIRIHELIEPVGAHNTRPTPFRSESLSDSNYFRRT